MAKKKSYDVFISYRRDGGLDFARSIAYYLRIEGYQCFFDQRELKTGQFNQQIYEAIGNSRHFIVVLTPGSLDRCGHPDDWVRAEIEYARKMGVHVVPVAVRGEKLTFPDSLPESLAWLKSAQASFIDRETDFEETIVKMVRNQLSDLDGMSTSQHRRVRREAERVFLKKASRFKNNDGVIDEEERTELERLASASGISRIRLEALIEQVETTAARHAKIAAWMKRHVLAVSAIALAIVALLAWMVMRACSALSPVPPPENAAAADGIGLPSKTPSKGKTAVRDIQTAARELKALPSDLRWAAENDLKHSLWNETAQHAGNGKADAVARRIIGEYEAAAAGPRKLYELGMDPQEVVDSRPDFVMMFADMRIRVNADMKQLIGSNRHEEALNYFNSAKSAFEKLHMHTLSRPSFSK